jgi:PKHD-type hydroxylase
MLLRVANVLTSDQAQQCYDALQSAEWVDGRITAGDQSSRVKDNLQVREGDPIARRIGEIILAAIHRNPSFVSATLPLKVFPPLFNRYEGGQAFGFHIDNAIRQVAGTHHHVRTDISATLFLTPPDNYDGGELVIEDTYGAHRVKLGAGDMIVYPGTSVHMVEPVTRGARVSSFFWIQSMVRDDAKRALLFDLDMAIRQVQHDTPQSPAAVQLTNAYHNLLRMWADA